MTTKFTAQRNQLTRALARLDEALTMGATDLVRDSAVKRFEFTFDLAWKLIQTALGQRGVRCASPRACFSDAFHHGFLPNDAFWFELLDARNDTVHAYNEEIAKRVYAKLPQAATYFHALLAQIPSEEPPQGS